MLPLQAALADRAFNIEKNLYDNTLAFYLVIIEHHQR